MSLGKFQGDEGSYWGSLSSRLATIQLKGWKAESWQHLARDCARSNHVGTLQMTKIC